MKAASRGSAEAPPIDLSTEGAQQLALTDALAARYALDRWAEEYSLMTAGYRDRLNPEDPLCPDVFFNLVTVAIMAEAKARVFERLLPPGQTGSVHIGGEARPHTAAFIDVASRIYAAHGFRVHLRAGVSSTPIWYSSYGVFYEQLQSGENFTASHSAFFKGGWKPMDDKGQQLLAQEDAVVSELRSIVRGRDTLALAPRGEGVRRDFDVDAPYLDYQRRVLGGDALDEIVAAGREGYRIVSCPLGGSMGPTVRRLFARLGAEDMLRFLLEEEDAEYHRMGHRDGKIDSVDPCEPAVYRHVGIQALLGSGEADLAFVHDPDGDRLKVVTTGPAALAERARALDVEVDDVPGSERCIVYLTPNQLFLAIVAFRIETLRASGDLDRHDWFVGLTFPTTKALEEVARAEGLDAVQVQVGFKYLGDLTRAVERQLGSGRVSFEMATGDTVDLGESPRALILCEESGGAALGGAELLTDRDGGRGMLALREKDGMQVLLQTVAMGARLRREGSSLPEYFCRVVERYGIRHLYYRRFDIRLYDEGLVGERLKQAKDAGIRRRDRIVRYFAGLAEQRAAGRSLAEIHAELDERSAGGQGIPALARACSTGDGTLFEFEAARFLLRASGTDALLRYYVEGTDAGSVDTLGRALIDLKIPEDA